MTKEYVENTNEMKVLFKESIDPGILTILMGSFFKNLIKRIVPPVFLDPEDIIAKNYFDFSQKMMGVLTPCTLNKKHSAFITLNHGNGKITEIQCKILEVHITKIVIEQYHSITFVTPRKKEFQKDYGTLRREIYFSTPTYYISEVKVLFGREPQYNFCNEEFNEEEDEIA
ncbi:MAG TPA: hypothetical protein PKZ36_00950 [Candidatus Paceibacterota bacterium]|nr:hypothetical protein [Candidatus Paceibacterota bacterium]HPT17961.1 hypothetical protein [Candidatus Paceibacterota bacterium]